MVVSSCQWLYRVYLVVETSWYPWKPHGKPPCALHMVASLIWVFTSILLNPLVQIALAYWPLLNWHPTFRRPLLHLQLTPYVVSVTIQGDHGSLWYLSQFVPLTNLVSMCFQWQMLWCLVFLFKTPCIWFLALINHLVSISGCNSISTISLCLVGEMI